MEAITTIILSAAKSVGVSGVLLLAICNHESSNFKQNYNPKDNGSPSFGVCQIKKGTAAMFGFKGTTQELMKPKVNALYAAKYLKYQQDHYGDANWVVLTAAYNAGKYNASPKVLGCPRNLGYIRLVKAQLPDHLKYRLNCGYEVAGNP